MLYDFLSTTSSPVEYFADDAALHWPFSHLTARHTNINIDRCRHIASAYFNSDLKRICIWGSDKPSFLRLVQNTIHSLHIRFLIRLICVPRILLPFSVYPLYFSYAGPLWLNLLLAPRGNLILCFTHSFQLTCFMKFNSVPHLNNAVKCEMGLRLHLFLILTGFDERPFRSPTTLP